MPTKEDQIYSVYTSIDDAGRRVDQLLAAHLTNISRSKIKKLIQNGKLYINNNAIYEGDYRVKPGDQITISCETAPRKTALPPTDIPLQIVYEDEYLLVINKPAGLVVHPGAGSHDDTMANALVHYLAGNLSHANGERPGIVHRLDRDTSGLLLVAKQDDIHTALSAQLARREIKREYFALVYGSPNPKVAKIETYIARSKHDRTKMVVQQTRGRLAITHYTVEQVYHGLLSAITCALQTGRTHQIRVHLTHKQHPIVGDQVYGRSYNHNLNSLPQEARQLVRSLGRQALHAKKLGFMHPITEQWMEFNSPLPEDINELLSALIQPPILDGIHP